MWISLLLTAALTGTAPAANPADEPIILFDLTYTLDFDLGDPAQAAKAWDHAHTLATLQGIVNRDRPRLYISYVRCYGRNVDDFWLQQFTEPGQWLHGRKIHRINDLMRLILHFRRDINGAVVYDPRVPATSNLASTIAGVEDLIAIRYDPRPDSLYTQLVTIGPRVPVVKTLMNRDGSPMFTGHGTVPGTSIRSTGSAKCDAYLWLKHFYLDTGKVDAGYAGHYVDAYWIDKPIKAWPDQHTLSNHDYWVSRKAWFFDLSVWADETPVDDPRQKLGTDLETLKKLLLSAYEQGGKDRMIHIGGFTPWAFKYTDHPNAGGKHGGVPTEWELAKIISAYNGFVDADAIAFAAMANASFYTHYPLEEHYPQHWPTHDELRERGYLTDDGRVNFDGREFYIFYVGDFDAAAWIYRTIPEFWSDPDRGSIPLMWCVTPIAERRAPMVLDYMRRTATPNDYFAAADNGAGYLNPGMLQEPRSISGLPSGLDAWVKHCTPLYKRWDLTITGFVIDGFAPGLNDAGLDAYAKFSPNGIVPQHIPPTLLHKDMPVLKASADLGEKPDQAAKIIARHVEARTIPFHWFRAILKSPKWYRQVHETAVAANPNLELLDGPTYFELLRIWLKNHPDAAAGKIASPR